jgi:hypothetical protein
MHSDDSPSAMKSRTTRCELLKQNTPRQMRCSTNAALVLRYTTRRKRETKGTPRLVCLNLHRIAEAMRIEMDGNRGGVMLVYTNQL